MQDGADQDGVKLFPRATQLQHRLGDPGDALVALLRAFDVLVVLQVVTDEQVGTVRAMTPAADALDVDMAPVITVTTLLDGVPTAGVLVSAGGSVTPVTSGVGGVAVLGPVDNGPYTVAAGGAGASWGGKARRASPCMLR